MACKGLLRDAGMVMFANSVWSNCWVHAEMLHTAGLTRLHGPNWNGVTNVDQVQGAGGPCSVCWATHRVAPHWHFISLLVLGHHLVALHTLLIRYYANGRLLLLLLLTMCTGQVERKRQLAAIGQQGPDSARVGHQAHQEGAEQLAGPRTRGVLRSMAPCAPGAHCVR
jgi:hypothetical protein